LAPITRLTWTIRNVQRVSNLSHGLSYVFEGPGRRHSVVVRERTAESLSCVVELRPGLGRPSAVGRFEFGRERQARYPSSGGALDLTNLGKENRPALSIGSLSEPAEAIRVRMERSHRFSPTTICETQMFDRVLP
jgi:hypothetical protein